MSKWLYRLETEPEGMCAQILRNKYLQSKTIAQVTMRPTDSPFWKGLMRTKDLFFHRVKFLVGNGMSTRLWEDTWLGEAPLALQYPTLYNIVQRKEEYVGTIFQTIPLNIQFRRALIGERWTAWMHLVRRLIDVQLSDQPDSPQWKLAKNGVFTVKSFYLDLINFGPISRSLHIWRIKVPLCIIFLCGLSASK